MRLLTCILLFFHTSFMCVVDYYRFNNIYSASKLELSQCDEYTFILAKHNLPVYCIGNLKDSKSFTKYFSVWDMVFIKDVNIKCYYYLSTSVFLFSSALFGDSSMHCSLLLSFIIFHILFPIEKLRVVLKMHTEWPDLVTKLVNEGQSCDD